jgi:hypothetical protein
LSFNRTRGSIGAFFLIVALEAVAGSSASFVVEGDAINAGANFATSASQTMQACVGFGGGEATSSSHVVQTGCGAVLAGAQGQGPAPGTVLPIPATSGEVLAALGALLALIGLARLRIPR